MLVDVEPMGAGREVSPIPSRCCTIRSLGSTTEATDSRPRGARRWAAVTSSFEDGFHRDTNSPYVRGTFSCTCLLIRENSSSSCHRHKDYRVINPKWRLFGPTRGASRHASLLPLSILLLSLLSLCSRCCDPPTTPPLPPITNPTILPNNPGLFNSYLCSYLTILP